MSTDRLAPSTDGWEQVRQDEHAVSWRSRSYVEGAKLIVGSSCDPSGDSGVYEHHLSVSRADGTRPSDAALRWAASQFIRGPGRVQEDNRFSRNPAVRHLWLKVEGEALL